MEWNLDLRGDFMTQHDIFLNIETDGRKQTHRLNTEE
jgi:hypothetical protein